MNTRLLIPIAMLASGCIDAKFQKKVCTLDNSKPCDPVLQEKNTEAGQCCWDSQYCSYDGKGQPACVPLPETPPLSPGSQCLFQHPDEVNQTDNCGKGLVCMISEPNSNDYRCMVPCDASLNCHEGVACSKRPGLTSDPTIEIKVCDPGIYLECNTATRECCNPLLLDNPMCAAGQICRVLIPEAIPTFASSSSNSFTTCEFAKGGGTAGAKSACKADWNCMEYHVCIGATPSASGTCKRVCAMNATDPSQMCSNADCVKLGDQYGYCPF